MIKSLIPVIGITFGIFISMWLRQKKFSRNRRIRQGEKMVKWMTISKEKRLEDSEQIQKESVKRKKDLINEIRKEYQAIQKAKKPKNKLP